MTHNLSHGMNGMNAKEPVILGTCSECLDSILEGEAHIKIRDGIGRHQMCEDFAQVEEVKPEDIGGSPLILNYWPS